MAALRYIMLIALAFCACSAGAATLTVTNLNDSGAGSLRDQIAAASITAPGDTIEFQQGLTGTIALLGELAIDKPLAINGPSGTSGITLSGNGSYRCFQIGAGAVAGPISVSLTNLVVTNCRVSGAASTGGAGLRVNNTLVTLALINMRFTACAAELSARGGALYLAAADSVTLTGCTFTNNTSANEAGAAQIETDTVVDQCVFTDNTAQSYAGAVNVAAGNAPFTDCTFSSNYGTAGGALRYVAPDNANNNIIRCTFSGNAAGGGGGLFVVNTGNLLANCNINLVNCTFYGNTSTYSSGGAGAAIYLIANAPGKIISINLTNCTLASNMASSAVATTIFATTATNLAVGRVIYRNSIIQGLGSDNINALATSGGTIELLSDDNNICSDGSGYLSGAHDQANTDPVLGALAANGGPTWTQMPNINSPAIDQGRFVSGVAVDQRSAPRPLDNASIPDVANGNGSDIGAVEAQSTVPAPEMDVFRGLTAIADGLNSDSLGSVAFGVPQTVTYTINNTGNAALNLTGGGSLVVAVAVTNVSSASVTTVPSTSIAAAGTSGFTITYTVSAAGAFSFTLSIANNDANENPYNWTVSGTGAASVPEMELSRAALPISDGGGDSVGNAAAGAPLGLTYVITNTGTASLVLSGVPAVAVSGLVNCTVSIVAAPPASVSASVSASFTVEITPLAAGAFSAVLSIANNDSNESPYDWTISGNGTTSGGSSNGSSGGDGGCSTAERVSLPVLVGVVAIWVVALRRRRVKA